ncbi:MAG: phosphomevalonate kinase [Nanoarchaeota archaeon]|nr:phosphomevalonate kinase [Nanoarchaeota archaeon]
MVKVFAPGKLLIAGEWAVLEGNPAVVAAVDAGVDAKVESCKDGFIHITIKEYGINDLACRIEEKKIRYTRILTKEEKGSLKILESAILASSEYIGQLKPFNIATEGKETTIIKDNKAQKIGFGSSAAATVSTIAAILKVHGIKYNPEILFKLAAVSHFSAQGKLGSGVDIAASSFGGLLGYIRFDDAWLKKKIELLPIKELIEVSWPGLKISPLDIPPEIILAVGWTTHPCSTSEMIQKMNNWKTKEPKKYSKVMKEIGLVSEEVMRAIQANDKPRIINSINRNGALLDRLSDESKVPIATPELRTLAEVAQSYKLAGKLSGAGGGDIGFALGFEKEVIEKVKTEWIEKGIIPVKAEISKKQN